MTLPDEVLGPGVEFDLIREILATANSGEASVVPTPRVELGAGDDCALIRGERIAVSTDLCVEGVHYRRDWITPREVGRRAAVAALSDLAAMAAKPIGLLLSIAIDTGRANVWCRGVAAGVGDALARHGGRLLGGDLSRVEVGGGAVLNVTVLGETTHPLLRSGSRPGDRLWVTGVLGGAAGAVAHWIERDSEPSAGLRRRFVEPRARIEEAHWLGERADIHAMIDLSDGLASDAGHLASAGRVRVIVDAERIPIDPDLVDSFGLGRGRDLALTGGEDYELAFTAPTGTVSTLVREFQDRFQLALTHVGEVTSGGGLDIVGFGSEAIRRGFDHFKGSR